jgi:hypothetical protein
MNSVSTVELNGSQVSLVPFGKQHITKNYLSWLNDQEMIKIILSAETTTTLGHQQYKVSWRGFASVELK